MRSITHLKTSQMKWLFSWFRFHVFYAYCWIFLTEYGSLKCIYFS
jgi:hypothetical protein